MGQIWLKQKMSRFFIFCLGLCMLCDCEPWRGIDKEEEEGKGEVVKDNFDHCRWVTILKCINFGLNLIT
jgi:hypothetical protein